MKKILLLNLIIFISFKSFAQVLKTENFNVLTIGNVSTVFTGATAGQGGYFLYSTNGDAPTTTTNASVNNAEIIDTATPNSLSLKLNGPNGNGGGSFVWSNDLPELWTSRTTGNDIIEIEVDVNTNIASTSKNVFGVYLYDTSVEKVLTGFFINVATKELFLVAYSTPAGQTVNNYNYNLAAAPGIIMPTNQVVRIGMSYNKITGEVKIKAPGIPAAGISLIGSAIGLDPLELDFVALSGSTVAVPNTTSSFMTMDNLTIKASSTDSLLKNDEFFKSNFSIYPNPTNDIVNISNNSNIEIKSVSITDINGRTVKEVISNEINSISTANLTSGIYFLKIVTAEGTGTTKLIKN